MSLHLGDRIEAYVLGRLSGPELDAAEEHLLGCRECFETASLMEAAIGVARERELIRLPAHPAIRRGSAVAALGAALGAVWQRPAWGALAGALAALLVVIVLGRAPRVDTGGLAAMEAYPLPAETLRAGTAAPERDSGLADYQAGRYTEAARRLEHYVAAEPDDDEARFYLAVSLLLDGKPRRAIPHLDRLVAGGGGYLRDSWYLAQAYLAVGEPDAARPYLRAVAAGDWIHSDRAREQLAALPPPGSQK